jgi:hypothetical protein
MMHDPNNIPEWVRETLTAYVKTGRPTGDFLYACLTNDLIEAIGRADENSYAHLGNIMSWIYNRPPSVCWRSKKAVDEWIKNGGAEGLGLNTELNI